MPQHRVAHDLRDLDVGLGRDLAGDVDEAGGHHRLDGDAAARVLREHRVEDRVGDLVTDLVRVSLGDGLGREQACGHSGLLGCDADRAWRVPEPRASLTGIEKRPVRRPTPRRRSRAWVPGRPRGPPGPRAGRRGTAGGRCCRRCPKALSTPDLVDDEQVAALAGQLGPGVVEHRTGRRRRSPRRSRRSPAGRAAPRSSTRPARMSGLRTSSMVGADSSGPPSTVAACVFLILAAA